MRIRFLFISFLLFLLVGIAVYFYQPAVWILVLIIPFILLGCFDVVQKKHTLWRNFPVIGHTRWLILEK